jgi:peptidoglycan/xylan/chitin deacetylase (PgdA/CDA1 family)
MLAVPEAAAPDLARECEGSAALRRRVDECAAGMSSSDVLTGSQISALAAAGMTIGFHTVDHEALPALADSELEHAVSHGLNTLAASTGVPVRYFAYPHGKADARSADAVRRAGFDAAFTGRPQPVGHGQERLRLGRWEPGPLGVDDLLVNLAIRLHRAGRPSRERSS